MQSVWCIEHSSRKIQPQYAVDMRLWHWPEKTEMILISIAVRWWNKMKSFMFAVLLKRIHVALTWISKN